MRRLFGRPPPHIHTSPLDPDYEPPAPPGEKRRTRLILALILTSVALAAAAQLTLKFGVNRVVAERPLNLRAPVPEVIRLFSHLAVWAGLALFAISAVFWMVALSRTSLSFAYPFAALTYVLILLFDWLVLKEPVVALRWVGVALIIGGLILVSRTGEHGRPSPQADRSPTTAGER